MGVSDGKPVLYDIGNLSRIEEKEMKLSSQEFLKKEMRLVLSWLHQNYPQGAIFLEKEIEQVD